MTVPLEKKSDAGVDAREAALDVLTRVLRRGVSLDDVLNDRDAMPVLDARDRAFVRMLTATTLRRLGQIDSVIGHCLSRPLDRKSAVAMDILRLGVAQLLFLRTPAHAAVDGSVRLATARRQHHMKGLVNAVLRRIAREGEALIAGQDAPRLNTPDWLWESWSSAYGPERCRAIARTHLIEPPLDFTVRADAERWAAALGGRVLPTGSVRRTDGGAVADLPGYADGAWWIQDAAAALPARLLAAAFEHDIAGRRIIDLCAAPGGKTAQLAGAGARVTAVESVPARMVRLQENLARLRLQAETVLADATGWRPDAPADAVLLDAPCAATGTIRRHPDVPHTKTPAEVERLSAVQSRLLDAAAEMIRPGGVLFYCVCSLQPEEGPEQTAAFLVRRPDFARMPITAKDIEGLAEAATGDGDMMSLPCHLAHEGGIDGFYAARFVRR